MKKFLSILVLSLFALMIISPSKKGESKIFMKQINDAIVYYDNEYIYFTFKALNTTAVNYVIHGSRTDEATITSTILKTTSLIKDNIIQGIKVNKSLLREYNSFLVSLKDESNNVVDYEPFNINHSKIPIFEFDEKFVGKKVWHDGVYPIQVDSVLGRISKDDFTKKDYLRGIWTASVSNLNFPSKPGLSVEELKMEWNKQLDLYEKYNLNAVFFQISPVMDSFFQSSYRTWSYFLTGKRDGSEPSWSNEFDLLDYMIDETHNRGMEFHAWINPYRVTHGSFKDIVPGSFADINKEILMPYKLDFDGKVTSYILNPGEYKSIDNVTSYIMELLDKYGNKIDGINFDDYFYDPKFNSIKDAPDKATFEKYGKDFENIESWRRNNIDNLIKMTSDTITKYNDENKMSVSFGVSPFGIWGHKTYHEGGSNTDDRASESYRHWNADTKKWVENEWIDYISPQIYWSFDTEVAPYGELSDWWSKLSSNKDVHLYISHPLYKNGESNNFKKFKNIYEMRNQVMFNETYENINGSVFYSAAYLEGGDNILNGSLTNLEDTNKNKALPPARYWLDKFKTKDIYDINVYEEDEELVIKFKDDLDNDSRFYVLYAREGREVFTEDGQNIVGIFSRDIDTINQEIRIKLNDVWKLNNFGISIKDRAGVESSVIKFKK